MSNLKKQYNKQMDSLCKDTNKLTVDDIMRSLGNTATNSIEEDGFKIVAFNPSSQKRRLAAWKASAAAVACVAAVSLSLFGAGAAGVGPASSFFSEKNNTVNDSEKTDQDKISQDIEEAGYVFEVNEHKTDGIFTANFLGVTGDTQNPMLMMKIVVDDEQVVANNDYLDISIYAGIEKNNYETGRYDVLTEEERNANGWYGFQRVTASKSLTEANTYILSVRGSLREEVPSVVAVRTITYKEAETDEEMEIFTDLRFDVTLSKGSIKEAFSEDFSYQYSFVGSNGVEYFVRLLEMSSYNSDICIHVDDTKLQHSIEDDEKLKADWQEYVNNLKIVVDGTDYTVVDPGTFNCNHQIDLGVDGICSAWPEFGIIPYEMATSIEIYYGDQLVVKVR